MNIEKMLINNARKAMLDNINALDKKTLQRELESHLKLEFKYKDEVDRLNNIIDNARKYVENNQSGCENENGHFHLNFDGDIWELYEMLRRF